MHAFEYNIRVTDQPNDLAVLPYSSGTTGAPKGCMHSHYTTMAVLIGGLQWQAVDEADVHLATLPMFHVTGMQVGMNGSLISGGTIVIMTRWDRRRAADLIRRHGVTRWRSIATMAIDMVNDPDVASYDFSSLKASFTLANQTIGLILFPEDTGNRNLKN